MFLPHIDIIDPAFSKLVLMNCHLEKLWSGGRWLEGPVWFGDMRVLLFSDIPNDRMLRYDEASGAVSVFRAPAGYSNGNTRDQVGRLITCEHGNRRVTRTEPDGRTTVLADRWYGKRLNSPNDVVVARDGAVWFTDPSYGIDGDYEGYKALTEIGASCLYRIDPDSGCVERISADFVQPNGLAFSPDGSTLYVADTGATHQPDGPRHIRRFRVQGTKVTDGDIISTCLTGFYDGFRVDEVGHIWTSTGEGVHCLTSEGQLLGRILVPEVVSNVCFGGPKRNRLFICATTSIYATYLDVSGQRYSIT
jgi:gluconolactonase